MKPLPDEITNADPFRAFVADMQAIGVQVVDQGGPRFAVIAARSNPRWWVIPLDNRRAAAAGLEMLQPVTRAAKAAKAVIRLLARFGPAGAVGKGHLCLSALPEVAQAFGSRAAQCAYFTGTDGPHRKTALQIMDQSGGILGYAKLSRKAYIRHYIRNEAEMLAHVAGLGLRAADVPAVVQVVDTQALSVLVTDSVKSDAHTAPLELGALHLAFLAELDQKTRTTGAMGLLDQLAKDIETWGEIAGPAWVARFSQGIAALRPMAAQMPLCLAHGDFTPWNTFLQAGRLYVFDWEYAQLSAPVGYDYIHFRLATVAPDAQPAQGPALVEALADLSFDGDAQAARATLLLSLMVQAAFYLRRLAEAGTTMSDWPEAPARAALIDPLLEDNR